MLYNDIPIHSLTHAQRACKSAGQQTSMFSLRIATHVDKILTVFLKYSLAINSIGTTLDRRKCHRVGTEYHYSIAMDFD